jgi:hypothetical protein
MKKTILLGAISAVASLTLNSVHAQENPLDTLAQSVLKTQAKVDGMSKIKLSGYIQGQYQVADSVGIASFAGGNFSPNVDNRFMLRRARLKATYDGNFSQYVFQVDVTEKGATIKDMYAKITEQWMKTLSLTVGMQNRPFGYEIGYSSSMRESPERGRMSQIIFPGERDLGAMITVQRPKGKPLDYLKIEAGMFNGTGGPSAGANASDFDWKKDFIGRIRIDKTTKSEKMTYGLGASYYNGGWRNGTSSVWNMEADSAGLMAFKKTKDTLQYGAISERNYIGVDGEVSLDWMAGLTTIRAEYIMGSQASSSSSTASPSSQPTGDAYVRNFNGAYLYFIQNIMHSKFDVVVKYDWYDPNADVAGDDIAKNILAFSGKSYKATSAADLKYTTLGFGLQFKVDANVKFVAYYDMVTNETTAAMNSAGTAYNLAPYQHDLKDNVFTLRMQYKF